MARGDFPSTKQDQFMLRFPDGMRDRLKAAAETNNRSMNAEIVARLEDGIDVEQEAWQLADEVERLRGELAYQQGKNASLSRSITVFVKFLAKASRGEPITLEDIQAELNADPEAVDGAIQ